MAYVIKAEIADPKAKTFAFTAQKTMYGAKHIAVGVAVELKPRSAPAAQSGFVCAAYLWAH